MTDRCGECERSAIFIHTAKLEREHDAMVIRTQAEKIAALEKALRAATKGQK